MMPNPYAHGAPTPAMLAEWAPPSPIEHDWSYDDGDKIDPSWAAGSTAWRWTPSGVEESIIDAWVRTGRWVI